MSVERMIKEWAHDHMIAYFPGRRWHSTWAPNETLQVWVYRGDRLDADTPPEFSVTIDTEEKPGYFRTGESGVYRVTVNVEKVESAPSNPDF
jgi:hypothetical protein